MENTLKLAFILIHFRKDTLQKLLLNLKRCDKSLCEKIASRLSIASTVYAEVKKRYLTNSAAFSAQELGCSANKIDQINVRDQSLGSEEDELIQVAFGGSNNKATEDIIFIPADD